jgi:PTH1 family peptidyl-tRNA hydrolase
MAAVQCIVGLGNPGDRYRNTRHNVGQWCVDQLAEQHQLTYRLDKKLGVHIAALPTAHGTCYLAKPTGYMNESGLPVARLARFYRIPAEALLVMHDELDFAPGIARLKQGGGHGGHNGLRDIKQHLPGDFMRLRLGIGHPGHADQVSGYVLGVPRGEEQVLIRQAIEAALVEMPLLFADNFNAAAKTLHTEPGVSSC